jgi:hypothetical protein
VPEEERHPRREFLLKEYETLQDKMKNAVNGLNRIETAVPIAMAGVFSWTFSFGRSETAIHWLLGMPVALALFGYVRTHTLYGYIRRLETYLSRLEAELYPKDPEMGWERNHGAFSPDPPHPELSGLFSWFTQRQLRLGTWFCLLTLSSGIWLAVLTDLVPTMDEPTTPTAQIVPTSPRH